MIIVWKHPDTKVPESYDELRQCNDETRVPGCITLVDPAQYFSWHNGEEWVFAEHPDGTLAYVKLSECAPEGEPTGIEGRHDDVAPPAVPDGQEGMALTGAGQGCDHGDPPGG